MKGTIASLIVLALELTLCLVSPQWRLIDVNNSQICFKNLLKKYDVSATHYEYLNIGPLFSSRIPKMDNIRQDLSLRITKMDNMPEHFSSNHTQTEKALLITGIVLIIISAITLSIIEFCSNKSRFDQYHIWLHLINVILLTISLILLIIGFYSLQHTLKHPLNGVAALGFFIGILFIVMLITHSAIMFWTHRNRDMYDTKIEKVVM
jgi:magnesium-transporting ATPase (P-type)